MSSNITFDIIGRDRSGSAAFNKVANSANRADGAMSKFSAGAMKVVKAGALASVAAGGFAVKLGVDAVGAASDLSETLNKSSVIFGKHADTMKKWGADAETSLGLSQNAALGFASQFGDMFKQLGQTSGQAADTSRNVVKLATDLGSFHNLETADVLDKIAGAMRGEYDSIQKIIPGLSDARVKQEALNASGKKSVDLLTEQDKAMAALRIITKDGAAANNDFAETSGGLANQTKILKAQLDNASASFGQKLLPLAVDFAQFANRELVPAIEKGAEWLGDRLPGAIDTVIDAGRDMRTAVAPAVEEIVEALGNLADEGDSAGKVFNNVFLPALSTTADVVAGVVDFVDDLPGPVKDLGVQAAIAAAVLPKLTGAVQGVTGMAGGFITNMKDAERRTVMFGQAARGAAGVGGMLALVSSAQETDRSLGALKETLGAAGVGGALAGPWGAAIGGAIAVAKNFAENMSQTGERVASTVPPINSMADSLDRLTGSMTATTRVSALENLRAQAEAAGMSVADFADVSGTSVRTLVDASLGGANAMDKVYNGLRRNGEMTTMATHDLNGNVIGYYESMSDGAFAVTKALGGVSRQLQEDKQAAREAALAAQDLTGKLKGIPDDVRVKVKEEGIPVTARGLAQLTKNAHLVPKQIRTLIKAADLPFTVKQILGLQKELDETDKKRPKPKVDADINPFQARDKHVRGLIAGLDKQKPTPKADLDLSAFFNARGTLIASLNSIPDEEVTIWTTRRDRNPGGGPSGGGPDLGYGDGNGRVAALGGGGLGSSFPTMSGSRFAAVQSRARASGASHASRRSVIEVRLIPAELDWSKAKTQINGEVRVIAGDVFVEQYQEERNFERQQG